MAYENVYKKDAKNMNNSSKKVTIKDVAQAAGVSYATVSRAFSGSSEIGEDTKKRILEISKEMGYSPNNVARSMVVKHTNTIGIIVPSIENAYMSEIISNAELKLKESGYNIMACNSLYDLNIEKDALQLLMGKQVDGLLIIPSGTETYSSLKPLLGDLPVVFIGENIQHHPDSYVSINNYEGTKMGTEYLFSLGHRHIVYLGSRKNSVTHQQRLMGYLDACNQLGIEPVHVDSNFKRSSQQAGYLLAQHLFEKPRDYSAIFCASDSLAIGVMQAADEQGIHIPEDISLMGFDNLPFTALPRIDLTTIDQSQGDVADAAVNVLVDIINNGNSGYVHKILQPTLIERSSCKIIDIGE